LNDTFGSGEGERPTRKRERSLDLTDSEPPESSDAPDSSDSSTPGTEYDSEDHLNPEPGTRPQRRKQKRKTHPRERQASPLRAPSASPGLPTSAGFYNQPGAESPTGRPEGSHKPRQHLVLHSPSR
jgi:hypothetical protein